MTTYKLCAMPDGKVHIYRPSNGYTRCHEVAMGPTVEGGPENATCNACRYAAGLPPVRTK